MKCSCFSCDNSVLEDEDYCPDCREYSLDEDGEPLCGLHDIPDDIRWGSIQTPGNGYPNFRIGYEPNGKRWVQEDRGGWGVPAPMAD